MTIINLRRPLSLLGLNDTPAKGICETANTDTSTLTDFGIMSAEASPVMGTDINSMPPELLSRILEHVFVRERQPVPMSLTKQAAHTEVGGPPVVPAVAASGTQTETTALDILLTSKAFYQASIEAFYTRNTLSFADSNALYDFISHIGSDRKKAIRTVAVRMTWIIAPPNNSTPQWRLLPQKQGWRQSLDCLSQLPKLVKLLLVVKLFVHAYKEKFGETSEAVKSEAVRSYPERSVREVWEREGLEVEVRYEEVRK